MCVNLTIAPIHLGQLVDYHTWYILEIVQVEHLLQLFWIGRMDPADRCGQYTNKCSASGRPRE